LNYRHHFHAGNFADVMKHALWLVLLAKLTLSGSPIRVLDTHAGAGLYDLQGDLPRRSREAEAGVVRLMADPAAPAAFDLLKRAVIAENPDGAVRYYPGSPLLTVGGLRRMDDYVGCELRADDQSVLQALLDNRRSKTTPRALAILADGYVQLAKDTSSGGLKPVYLIDPPFERGDEYDQILAGVSHALAVRADATVAIWAPLKDLETFDALLRGLEAIRPSSLLVAEARLRPLLDPMKMNGSALIFIGAPDMEAEARTVSQWIVAACGETGGAARVRKLGL